MPRTKVKGVQQKSVEQHRPEHCKCRNERGGRTQTRPYWIQTNLDFVTDS